MLKREDVYIDPGYLGEKEFSCYIKKNKTGSAFGKLLGKWNRRFLTVSIPLKV